MRYILLWFLGLALAGCTPAGSSGGAAGVDGVAVIDVGAVLQRHPGLAALKKEEETYAQQSEALVEEARAIQAEMKDVLGKMPDRTSLGFRDKESHYHRRLAEVQSRLHTAQLALANKLSSATDEAYRAMMAAALKVARRRGASVVLPTVELPNPHFELGPDENPVQAYRQYEGILRARPVIASTHSVDITADVLRELRWTP